MTDLCLKNFEELEVVKSGNVKHGQFDIPDVRYLATR